MATSLLNLVQGILQQHGYLLSDLPQPRILGYLDPQPGVHSVDQNRIRCIRVFAHDDVARQQNSKRPVHIDLLLHKRAITRTKNHIILHIFLKLFSVTFMSISISTTKPCCVSTFRARSTV
ncbi:hypothetical protein A8144_09230 [Mycobacterium leprae 3125609]|nr:hypothetical protein A8144_09230 [Mycobacterium leprae 3125609]OAX70959.1 hypothetical protein A3216_08700 [Mycobacterium leprae 7935681]